MDIETIRSVRGEFGALKTRRAFQSPRFGRCCNTAVEVLNITGTQSRPIILAFSYMSQGTVATSGSGDKRQSPTLKPVVMWMFFIKSISPGSSKQLLFRPAALKSYHQNPHQDVPEIRHSESGFNGASGIRLLGGGETAWEGDPDGGDGGGKPGELRDLRKIAGAVGVARHSEKADKVVDVEWASE
ncbi:hypothetical protein BS47DRAFT_1385503 [Hydnum rufescens UP504]|uniref:Uncharacterized protein n=1 Tax=Hydnum rufescens UP504 TaxID=1448309 RepID=A0A9P6AIP0_9AGAM|nr:hypothetical protein BS47DRAFT_1385503 [Hydnum rufescens UP504]